MKLGLNLSSPNYGESDIKCGDAMRHFSNWSGIPNGGGWPLTNPLLPSGGYTIPALQGYRRSGTYLLCAGGSGELAFNDASLGNPLGFYFGSQGGGASFAPITLKGGSGLGSLIRIYSNNGDLRNCQLLVPGAIPGELWHPQYLSSITPFSGGYRHYNFLGSTLDTGPGCTWESRIQRTGIGIEAAVDICNKTHRDMWLILPVHCLTTSGLTNLPQGLGAYLAQNLDPSLTVYIEPGNELWNGMGGYVWQYQYLQQVAKTLINPITNQPFVSLWLSAAYLLHTATDIIASFGVKVKRVLSGQCTWYGNSAYYLVTHMNNNKWPFDVISCAPYANWPNTGAYTIAAVAALVAAGDINGAINLIVQGLQYTTTSLLIPNLTQWKKIATTNNASIMYYEMGPDYSALWSNPGTAPAAQAFRNSQQAGDFCTWFLQQVSPFADVGMWFQDCSLDCWGARAHADDVTGTESKIWPALMSYIQANP